jgi:hypothetical protein
MKKLFLVSLLVFMAAVVYSQSGTIRELTGEVELRRANSLAFTPARLGDTVAQDTIISTGFRSTTVITIGSAEITVRPLTRLSLAEIQSSAESEELNINLQAGRIRVDVKPPAGTRATTTVQSPSATASVRGTTFEMDTQNLNVSEGSVAWGGSDGLNVMVSSGSSSTISNTGGAVNPVETSTAGLTPPLPPGSGSAGETVGPTTGPSGGPADSGGISVDVGWGNNNGDTAGGGGLSGPGNPR